jgi:outer membrane protein
MNLANKLVLSALAVVSGLTAAPAFSANDSPWQVRARALFVAPSEHSTLPVQIDNSFVPELDVSYFVDKHWALELIAAVTPHTVAVQGLGDLADVWLLPPTLTVQYHLDPDGQSIRPYVGAGINYTTFFGVDEAAGINKVKLDDSFGLALQAGFDIPFGGGWSANVDVKKIFISTDATVVTPGPTIKASVDIDPVVVGIGVGYRY